MFAATTGCARSGPTLTPQATDAPVPDLRGSRVMLYPAQSVQGVPNAVDAEIGFALSQRPGVVWVGPAEMRRALTSSPGLDSPLEGLPVGMFAQVEVQRIGDPLFGYLRRMSALVGSDIALVPVFVRFRPESPERPSGIEVAATLISARNGQVLWFGVVEGATGAADDPRSLASAAEALGRRLVPTPGRD